ncbi:hypothetical protein ACG98H_06280 [Corynebacterium sp. L4756]|uniref:hypothetical protein n=1 Tax=unclassified Corynebacterium TaxID=2624378 RepID=UPI00374DA1EF
MIASIIFYVVLAVLAVEALGTAWKLYRNKQEPVKPAKVLGSLIFHIVLVAFFGVMAPWGISVSIIMWWILVLTTGIYAGVVTWRLMLNKETQALQPA